MGRLISIVLIVLGIWVAVEVHTEGLDRAFGGAFAGVSDGADEGPPAAGSAPQRAGHAVQAAHAEASERRRRLLAE